MQNLRSVYLGQSSDGLVGEVDCDIVYAKRNSIFLCIPLRYRAVVCDRAKDRGLESLSRAAVVSPIRNI
jgi:hypothetical protein